MMKLYKKYVLSVWYIHRKRGNVVGDVSRNCSAICFGMVGQYNVKLQAQRGLKMLIFASDPKQRMRKLQH